MDPDLTPEKGARKTPFESGTELQFLPPHLALSASHGHEHLNVFFCKVDEPE
jgi:hypothetical protein